MKKRTKKSVIKKMICSFGATILLLSSEAISPIVSNAYPEFYFCYPIFEQQEYSNLCWAACSLMSGRKAYPTTTASQYSIVCQIKNNGNSLYNYNLPASGDDEIISAADYVTNYTKSYYTPGHPMPPTFIKLQFNTNKVPMMQVLGRHYNGYIWQDYNIYHLVIPYIVEMKGGQSYNDIIYYYDPLNGITNYAKYGDMINGNADYSHHSSGDKMKYIKMFYH